MPDAYIEIPNAASLLAEPLHFPDEFKRWMLDYFAVNPPQIPYSHIFGSRINLAREGNYVAAQESCASSATYVDLATVGPQLTNVADGKYLVMYGASSRGRTSISVNGAVPSDDDSVFGKEAVPSTGRMKIVTVKNNNQNSFKLQYKELRNFSRRWLTIVRIGAPGA